MAYESGWVSIIELQDGQVVSDALNNAFLNIDTSFTDIENRLDNPTYPSILFTPQTTPPVTLVEGMMYYDLPSHSFVAIDDIAGTKLNLGQEISERCFNPSITVPIPNGRVVAVTDLDANDVLEIEFADATTLDTAVAFGMTTSDFATEGLGKVTQMGRVNDVDTAQIAVNETVYLSDAGDGSLTGTPPEITTVIGYVVKEQSAVGVADGIIYINPRSIIALPNVVAFMNQNAPTTPTTLSTSPLAINNYDVNDSGKIIMDYVPLTGIITAPSNGIYDMTIDFGTDYAETTDNATHLLVQIMADNGVDAPYEVGRYNKEVAKRSVTTNGSMTKTFKGEKDVNYYMVMSAPNEDFSNFVLENVSFSLKSIDIR